MAIIGSNANRIIDKMVDFMASTQAFMEYLDKAPEQDEAMESVPPEKIAFYLERLEHYRDIYKQKTESAN
ncbi:hypothetical protein F9C28_14055 [Shimwellia pseudoproteus]|uniref:hypothetical protein n=1 Tax=Shimwellia pseudoproteus TaxID=570012 RepID=UPI0018EB7DEB|nr:hypothetical protein [Shimwellia pseudoproteus]